MKKHSRRLDAARIWTLALATLAVLSTPAPAQEDPEPLRIVAVNVTAEAEGRRPDEGSDAPVSRPGDVIEYRLLFTNTTPGAVRDVVFDDPVPRGLVYVGGSAAAEWDGVEVEFSIDGGTTYTAQPEIEVEEDGRKVRRPAPLEMYTHVRWTIRGTVAPGEEVEASFRARIASRPTGT